MENRTLADYKKPITKKELLKEISQEKKRLYNKTKNIRYYFSVKDYMIELNYSQFLKLINRIYCDDEGLLHQNYDDMNEFIHIELYYCTDKKSKSKIYIYG